MNFRLALISAITCLAVGCTTQTAHQPSSVTMRSSNPQQSGNLQQQLLVGLGGMSQAEFDELTAALKQAEMIEGTGTKQSGNPQQSSITMQSSNPQQLAEQVGMSQAEFDSLAAAFKQGLDGPSLIEGTGIVAEAKLDLVIKGKQYWIVFLKNTNNYPVEFDYVCAPTQAGVATVPSKLDGWSRNSGAMQLDAGSREMVAGGAVFKAMKFSLVCYVNVARVTRIPSHR